jgi:hypothetical protein
MRRIPTAALVILLLAGPTVQAQHLPPQVLPAGVATAPQPALDTIAHRGDTGGAVLGALVFGGIATVTAWRSGNTEAVLWAEAVGIALGAHVGNGGRGNAVAPLIASIGALFLGRVLAHAADFPTEDAVLIIPMVQIAAAVAAETATTPGARR